MFNPVWYRMLYGCTHTVG